MRKTWQLQEAKNKFSEVITAALQHGPQTVTKRGKEAIVIVSFADYQALIKPPTDVVDFFKQSPLFGQELEFEREQSAARTFEI